MDADWRPVQGSDPAAAAGGDWRGQLQPEERGRIVGMMMETLQRNNPGSVPEVLNEFRKIAVLFEEKIYTAATDNTDYFRKISAKMLSMETKTQHAPGNVQVISSQNNPGQASVDYTAQTGYAGAGAGDWQEEIYQMIKSLKDQHFVELNKLFNKVSVKLQHVDIIRPRQMPSGQYERMKSFKTMLNRILQVLQISKSAIQPALRNKVPQYEKQIISIFNSQRRKTVQPQAPQRFQPPAGQASNSNTWQQQQHSQSLQQLVSISTGLQSSSMVQTYSVRYAPAPATANFGVPTQQNGANTQHQASFNMEAAQRRNFNSLQYGSMGGALRQGSTGPMQGTLNAQLQTGSSSMLSDLSGQRNHMTKRKWHDTL